MKRSSKILAAGAVLAIAPAVGMPPAEFAAECGRRATVAEAASERAVAGDSAGWVFLTSELRHLAAGEFWNTPSATSDPLAAITAYHKALGDLGVQLVLVPVPAKASIYPDKLETDAGPGDAFPLAPLYEKLRAEGVSVVDLDAAFRRMREREKVFCEQDSHWAPVACRVAAEEICAHPAVKQLFNPGMPVPRSGTDITITGDLAEALPSAVSGREILAVYPAAAQPVPPADDSPVLLLGDSHTVVFSTAAGTIRHHATGAGLRDHLQARLGFPLGVHTNASSGADAARALVARKANDNPSFWKGRKLVIWCFAAREFTRGPWRKIPADPRRETPQ